MDDIFETKLKDGGEELLEGLAPDFPYTASRALLNHYDVPWHWHRAVELFYMESGTLEYDTPQGRTVFPSGSGGLVNTGVLHRTRRPDLRGPTVQLLHLFDASLLFGPPESAIFQRYGAPLLTSPGVELVPLYPDNPRQGDALERLRESFHIPEGSFGYELRLREALAGIWLELLALLPPEGGQGRGSSEKMKRMLCYVHGHFRESIKTAEIAAAGYVSERECYRAFQNFLHTTPMEYVRDCRLQLACRMLAEGGDTVTQISQTCGFASSSFFGKVFLNRLGLTPTAYRQKWQDTTK